jgi:hypothetical protein
VEIPVLVLAWAGDPGHPVSTAARLAEVLPHARLEVAETPAQRLMWGALAAQFMTA